jgi:shikimate dehydrogenase
VKPRRFAVVGDPIAHSKSPAMHSAAYRALGLPHSYEAVRVTPDELSSVVQALREGRYDGLSVTVPHKQRALALADDVDATARDVGAANTLARVGARVVAFNTDAPALALELSDLAGPRGWLGMRDGRALVLGGGGAGRAALRALGHDLGTADVVLRARRSGPAGVPVQPWRPDPDSEGRTRCVVQATSAGMQGADPGESAADAVAWDALPDDAVALDVVYAPPETPFLRAARARGLRAVNGLGMLARQGALAFEIWLGTPAPLAVMRAALELAG